MSATTATADPTVPGDGMTSPSRIAATRFEAPSGSQRLRELAGVITPLRSAASIGRLYRAARGDGRAVVAYPGFGASDASLVPLRRFLGSRGHDPYGWDLGVNRGDPIGILDDCISRLDRIVADTARPANLVGWSLGGVIAREIARDRPDLVHRVATIATPLFGPRYTVTRRAYDDEQLTEIDRVIDERSVRPLARPVLAIHGPNDGVVDPRSCVDDAPTTTNLTVSSTHLTMALDPDAWVAIADWYRADR